MKIVVGRSSYVVGRGPNLRLLRATAASERKTQSRADFSHTSRIQVCHTLSQPLLGNGDRIVKVHCTRSLHSILFSQDYLGRNATNSGRDRRDSHARKVADRAIAGENNDRSFLVWCGKLVEANVSARYSAATQPPPPTLSIRRPRGVASSTLVGQRCSCARTSSLRRCCRSASRTKAERLRFIFRAAWSVACKSVLSRTI
jgi:hypothetical protein